ncbi:MAG TPA: hypothetical protein VGW40_06815, partial [Allosphingosinicella sp.]|nr:hypothetical protein [Allosphingosinicella sp.]
FDGHMAGALSSAASAVANAGARTLIDGSDFGDNLLAALPDVIGSTIGHLVASSLASAPDVIAEPEKQDAATETPQVAGAAPASSPVLTDAQRRQLVTGARPDAIASIEQAAADPSLDPAERADLEAAARTLRRGGITYRYGRAANQPNSAASAGMVNGVASITINLHGAGLFNPDGTVNVGELARSLLHEARHIYDNRFYGLRNGPTTLAQVRRTERNAYRTEAAYLKSTGLTGYAEDPNGVIVPLTSATANFAAEASVKSWVNASAIEARRTNANIDRSYAVYLRQVAAYNRANGTNIRPTPRQRHIVPPVYVPPASY